MKKKIETTYEQRELILGALLIYEIYLRTGNAVCTYGLSPRTAKDAKRLENKLKKIHFAKAKTKKPKRKAK